MAADDQQSGDMVGPVGGGPVTCSAVAVWLPACLAIGILLAWASLVAASHFAPLVLFPLLVGVLLGALLVGLIRVCQMGNRPLALLGVVLSVLVMAVAQHYISYYNLRSRIEQEAETYRDARRAFGELVKGPMPAPPAGFADYMRKEAADGRPLFAGYVARGRVAWLSWVADGLLMMAAAVAMVVSAVRLPYCSRCRSWYRTSRTGRLDAATVRRLGQLLGFTPPGQFDSARYRLLNCNAGCGPTGLVLSWEGTSGDAPITRLWLDPRQRNQLDDVLDQACTDQNLTANQ